MVRRVSLDLTFERDYSVGVLAEMDPSLLWTAVNFGGPQDPAAAVVVRVVSGASEWTGVIGCGYDSPPGINEVIATPNPGRLCVVAGGRPVSRRASDPADWHEIPQFPVIAVMAAYESRLLLLADFTSVMAWGADGGAWKTRQVSWDGIRLNRVTADGVLRGEGWSAPEEQFVPFGVDLRIGSHKGGSSPQSGLRPVP